LSIVAPAIAAAAGGRAGNLHDRRAEVDGLRLPGQPGEGTLTTSEP